MLEVQNTGIHNDMPVTFSAEEVRNIDTQVRLRYDTLISDPLPLDLEGTLYYYDSFLEKIQVLTLVYHVRT